MNMDNFIFWGLCSEDLGFRACVILHVSVPCVWGPEPLVTVTVRRQREHEVFFSQGGSITLDLLLGLCS